MSVSRTQRQEQRERKTFGRRKISNNSSNNKNTQTHTHKEKTTKELYHLPWTSNIQGMDTKRFWILHQISPYSKQSRFTHMWQPQQIDYVTSK